MALPVITSVTQATAPQANSAKQPDSATWSSALAAADTTPPAQQADTNADSAKKDTSTADTSASSSTKNQDGAILDNTGGTSAEKKPAKHVASSVTAQLDGTTPTDSTDHSQQAVSPFAAMLLSNSAVTADKTAQPAAKVLPVQTAPLASQVALKAQPASEVPAAMPDNPAAGGVITVSATSAKANAVSAAGAIAAPAASTKSVVTPSIATVQVAGGAIQPTQAVVTGTASSTVTDPGTQAPAAVTTAAVASAAKSAPSTAASLLARGAARQAVVATSGTDSKTAQVTQPAAASSISAMAQVSATTSASTTTPVAAASTVVAAPGAVDGSSVTAGSASALAATVIAMHQAGQSGAVLRLDPPGLGNLSVHVGLGQQGQVNVLFVPDSSAGAQALQSGLNGLSQAMAQSGLTLGQAQVGGQFGQSAGQGGRDSQGWRGGGTSTPQRNEAETARKDNGGVSAYA